MNNNFEALETKLREKGYEFDRKDWNRPWGAFWVIDERQTQKFIDQYFPDYKLEDLKISDKLSPKILYVAPEKRLSWQYHHRRAEIWRVIEGQVAVMQSDTDEQTSPKVYKVGDTILLKKGTRHRLIGLEDWGTVAEIWQHTEEGNPSDENDIVRLQDDFKRKSPSLK